MCQDPWTHTSCHCGTMSAHLVSGITLNVVYFKFTAVTHSLGKSAYSCKSVQILILAVSVHGGGAV